MFLTVTKKTPLQKKNKHKLQNTKTLLIYHYIHIIFLISDIFYFISYKFFNNSISHSKRVALLLHGPCPSAIPSIFWTNQEHVWTHPKEFLIGRRRNCYGLCMNNNSDWCLGVFGCYCVKGNFYHHVLLIIKRAFHAIDDRASRSFEDSLLPCNSNALWGIWDSLSCSHAVLHTRAAVNIWVVNQCLNKNHL